ncbi:MAG: cyclic nucleotide-binding domain-containing protein [bacterium]|nr:cyclic nucleotide-binding domain-containing protein [bacterium]
MAQDLSNIKDLLFSEDIEEQEKALKALTSMEDKETLLFMLSSIPKVNKDVQGKLLHLVHGIKQAHKIPLLNEFFSSSPPAEHLEIFTGFFQQKKVLKYYQDLFAEAVKAKEDSDTIIEHIQFLTHIADPASCEVMSPLVSSGKTPVKLATLEALDKLEYSKIANTLLITYKREDDDVALKVVEILKKRNMAKESVSLVHSLMDKSEEVQKETINFMSSADREELKKFLGEALKNEEEEFKNNILELFKKHGVSDLASDIKEAAMGDEEKIRREETILIISNIFLSRFTLLKILAPIYNISEAQDANQAITTMKDTHIDLVIADKNLPNMKINELVKNVRQIGVSIPIVLFFSNLSDNEKEEVRKHGINYFLIKPFHKEEVLTVINQSLDSSKKTVKIDRYVKAFTKGESLFREGEKGNCCYLIQQGRVRIMKERSGAKPLVLAELTSGDLLGEMALITKSPRSATAIAVTDCIMVVVGSNNFDTMITQSPDFAKKLILVCSGRIRRMSNQIKDLYTGFEDLQRMINKIVSTIGGK